VKMSGAGVEDFDVKFYAEKALKTIKMWVNFT
jgi:hypothetical protein